MIAIDDDLALAWVSEALPNRAKALTIARDLVRGQEPLARKALWVMEQVLPERVETTIDQVHFADQWLEGQAEFIVSAALAAAGRRLEIPDPSARTVAVSWHMPEWPMLLASVPRLNGLALIAQDAAWIRRAVGSSSVLPFRKAGAAVALARAFRSGRPIVAMLDYCYDETAAVETPFLGRMSRTPIGLFALARRYGYGIDVLSIANGAACTVERIEPRLIAISDNVVLAGTVNEAIGGQVLLDPARWLLWPALDRRWTGSDAVPLE